MRRLISWSVTFFGCLIFLVPQSAVGQELQNYFVLKAGIFTPTGDLKDNDFDSGFNGEIAYGYYYNPNLVFEFGLGYFQSEASASGSDPILGDWSGDEKIMVVPLTLTAKGVLPLGRIELYGGAGIGAYFTSDEAHVTVGGMSESVDDSDTVWGGHVTVGVNFNVSKNLFMGVEGKHVWTDKAEYSEDFAGTAFKAESDVNGYAVTGNLGFRF